MMEWRSSPVVRRFPGNPVLSAKDVPFQSVLAFNAGVARYQGRYVMLFRNDFDYHPDVNVFRTNLEFAFSDDGLRWQVQPRPVFPVQGDDVWRIYDPRLTVLDGRCYVTFAMDTTYGIRAAVAVTDDFDRFEILSLSLPDNRNTVLYPERVGGRYVRMERPFDMYLAASLRQDPRLHAWISFSPDLRHWGDSELLLAVEHVPFANEKVGPGTPPVRTPRGWLALFHAVDTDPARGKRGWEERWQKRYTAGVMLLDLEDPRRVVGMSKEPFLVPEAPCEREGFRNDVVFPSGLILEDTGEVKIYYGAADTVVCLATADLGDLLALCTAPR
ncbi:glycoside hydrolase family 130 protein [Limnochorda pilosa]|nr:glycoside hydrolase family 130 protein [Limnochorda pilosa]